MFVISPTYQMAVFLRESGVDLTDDTACLRALVAARFRAQEVIEHHAEAAELARVATVAVEMARG